MHKVPHEGYQSSAKVKRIFWLGMHKILVTTELPRLRVLGYEVFNPNYLSNVLDQSSNTNWDSQQPTTLPASVFKSLSEYNFFYNNISDNIAALLNKYFDTVIVTISPLWLAEVLRVYKGRVIYRTYGQHGLLSDELEKLNLLVRLSSRENFVFMPHAHEALNEEHAWLKERALVTPYCLPDDVCEYQNTWKKASKKRKEIIITCPNINNIYFKEHFKYLKQNFHEKHFRFFGVQMYPVGDKQVVGTLDRKSQLERFQNAAGYLYTYTTKRVCYLPPIEMMVIGGPVLFLEGSLLCSYFGKSAPGRCKSVSEAKEKVNRLLRGDTAFINEVIASQEEVKCRYHTKNVWPIFDKHITLSLNAYSPPSLCFTYNPAKQTIKSRTYLLLHFHTSPVFYDGSSYYAVDGIVRVMRPLVQALNEFTDKEIIITARADYAQNISGFFRGVCPNKERIRVMIIDPPTKYRIRLNMMYSKVKLLSKRILPHRYWASCAVLLKFIENVPVLILQTFGVTNVFLRLLCIEGKFCAKKIIPRKRLSSYSRMLGAIRSLRHLMSAHFQFNYVSAINRDSMCSSVLVPHYYAFPEALVLKKPILLYLFDYMPHFFQGTKKFASTEGACTEIGIAIVKKAKTIITSSEFTKSYLPKSRLYVDSQKIKVLLLPTLSKYEDPVPLPEDLTKYGYVFYPTRPHPNKNLALLLDIFRDLLKRGHDLKLVLTAPPWIDTEAANVYKLFPCKERIIIKHNVSNSLLQTLYQNAALLCVTSLAEGNFPPQIQEALSYQTPVVASDLNFITERIPHELKDCLVLCESNNKSAFIEACEKVLKNRDKFVNLQDRLRTAIERSVTDFAENVKRLFN